MKDDKRCNKNCRICKDVKSGDVHGCSCHAVNGLSKREKKIVDEAYYWGWQVALNDSKAIKRIYGKTNPVGVFKVYELCAKAALREEKGKNDRL